MDIAPADVGRPPARPADETGLTGSEAQLRLAKYDPNAMLDTMQHPLQRMLEKVWAPVPWMLEGAAILELALGKYIESAVIAALLLFNVIIGLVQEGRAQTLNALKSRLAMTASARRDGAWVTLPAAGLVPGDIVKLSLGGVVAADATLITGSVLLGQSMITGESIPTEAGPGRLTATGTRTKFGRTAELVIGAYVVSSQQKAVVRVVRNLTGSAGCVIVVLGVYSLRPSSRAVVDPGACADSGARFHPGCPPGHIHARGGDRRAGAGQTLRLADTSLGRR